MSKHIRDKVAEKLVEGKGVGEAAEELGVHRNSVSYHKKSLTTDMSDSVQEYRAEILIKLAEIESLVSDPSIDKIDKAKVLLDVVKQLRAVYGTDAPTKSISARIDATGQPQYEFLEHSHGLTRDQLDEVFRFMDSLPRHKVTIDMSGFAKENE